MYVPCRVTLRSSCLLNMNGKYTQTPVVGLGFSVSLLLWFHSVFCNHLIHPHTLILSFQMHASAVLMRAQNPCYNNSGSQKKRCLCWWWGVGGGGGAVWQQWVWLWTNKPLRSSLCGSEQDVYHWQSSFKNFTDEIFSNRTNEHLSL